MPCVPLHIEPEHSPLLRAYSGCAHGLALAILPVLAIPVWSVLCLAALVFISAWISDCRLQERSASLRVLTRDRRDVWAGIDGQGRERTLELTAQFSRSPLITLEFRGETDGRCYRLTLAPDSLSARARKALRMHLLN